ncbi:MAG TPA: creatininase family protein, partial [Polyangia bacterium]|nr:creatininase family protein [Polyangia bacterium]
ARVWTDADRLYSWMLRRLPFIRPDFASVRSDEYPLRLWTVAVFLFGSLPLLRKRGIGRLVIGDEYDTTVRASYGGIPHYAGLYDQSRYFDNALSRYFRAKGFGVAQFSLLRPLSELLIEKALAERYPDLQREQVSCHSAHERDGRIHPCGKCEKCRRIVGMLLALGADPRACGYTAEQIAALLGTLATFGVHQESAGARQLFHLLSERGLLPAGASAAMSATEHPEVMKLRFDRERAPFDTIPRDLREPLYRILLEHADGAVQRNGRVWQDVDPLGEPALFAPYRNEDASWEPCKGEADPATHTDDFLLGEVS